jgi:cell division transport system permease protein
VRLFRAPTYFVSEALANLARHPLYSAAGILTLAVSLILAGFLGLFMWKANTVVDRLAGGLRMTVYLDAEVTQGAANELVTVISEQWTEVESVAYHSQAEDRARNSALLPPELMEELDAELVPAQPYLEVRLEVDRLDEGRLDSMVQWFSSLSKVRGVDEVLFGAEKISAAFSLLQAARRLGVTISLVVVLAALFFVFTTTRLIVEGRRKEIAVLLMVGATPNFIRIPHYLEGVIQGALSGVLAFVSVWFMQRHLMSTLRGDLLLQVPVNLLPPGMILWFLVGGIALGTLGAALAMTRYLRLSR